MAKQVVVNPEARLEAHPSDVAVSDKQVLELSLFAKLKRKPSLEKFPGAWILRKYKKGEVIFRQGELFGEMSCMYRTPRSGTVVAARDCYMIELMRNILDALQKDPAYKQMTDELYKKRVLQMHLQKLSLFRDLTPEQYAAIQKHVELVS